MKTNQKGKRKMKKGAKVVLLLLAVWLILGTIVAFKVTAPSVNSWILKDNHVYAQQNSNPSNWEAKDKAFNEYNEYSNSLVNSKDAITSWFFQQNTLVKLVVYIAAIAPLALIAFAIVEEISEFFTKKSDKNVQLKKCRA